MICPHCGVFRSSVNVLKGKVAWDAESKFDGEKDKTKFRQYEDACARVKSFYKEQHGSEPSLSSF